MPFEEPRDHEDVADGESDFAIGEIDGDEIIGVFCVDKTNKRGQSGCGHDEGERFVFKFEPGFGDSNAMSVGRGGGQRVVFEVEVDTGENRSCARIFGDGKDSVANQAIKVNFAYSEGFGVVECLNFRELGDGHGEQFDSRPACFDGQRIIFGVASERSLGHFGDEFLKLFAADNDFAVLLGRTRNFGDDTVGVVVALHFKHVVFGFDVNPRQNGRRRLDSDGRHDGFQRGDQIIFVARKFH